MKEIGGYFGLELARYKEYHCEAIKLNSGRNSFKYILEAQNIKKVYVPIFICNSIIEPLDDLGISYEFYNVDEKFEIVEDFELSNNEKLFYVNYFSLKSKYIESLSSKYADKLIVDNTHSFFEAPIKFIDTIYSPRKFFGISDGGYLYTQRRLKDSLETDVSYNNSMQLFGRVDVSASGFYENYQKSEDRLINRPIKKMSKLTSKILSSIDYDNVKTIRERNFYYLHSELKYTNLLNIDMASSVPFVYPLMVNNEGLRAKLISNKIYVAKYWEEVLGRQNISSVEKDLVNKILPLPIDQRYSLEDMKIIVDIVKDELE